MSVRVRRDVFSGAKICYHEDCQWRVPDSGWSGIAAKHVDDQGRPCCWDHYSNRPADKAFEEPPLPEVTGSPDGVPNSRPNSVIRLGV